MKHLLKVVVNEQLTLDAGWWEECGDDPMHRIVYSPSPTMFEQVLAYLEHVVDTEPKWYDRLSIGREAVVATAVCLRWGSYLAVLLDHSKPVSAEAKDPQRSRIANTEMARINIESSAALAQWIDIMRGDWDRYRDLMRASERLPMPQQRVKRDPDHIHLLALSRADFAARLHLPLTGEVYDRVAAHPTRMLANGLMNASWRNGPVEDIHAGQLGTYPLLQRRVTRREEQTLMRTTAERLAQGLRGVSLPRSMADPRPWVEQVLPFAWAAELLVTDHNWTLEEKTREVQLPGGEPGG